MPLPRSFAEILALHADATKNDIKKCVPATVTAVHLDRQTVDVQIAINNPLNDDLGNVITEPAPSLSDVPYGVMRGGGFMVSLPIAVGDSVLLVFSDLSCDTWREGDGTAQDPGFVGKHTHDSPFAIPMFDRDANFFADPSAGSASGKLLIGKDGSAAQIRISPTDIELGNNAIDAVALASKVDAIMLLLKTFATAMGAGFLTPAGGFTGPQATAVQNACTALAKGIATVASTLVKAQ